MTWPILTPVRLRMLSNTAGGDPATAQRQLEWNRAAADAVWRPLEVIGGAAAAFGASGATTTTGTTAPTVAYPTGITNGQLLVMFVANRVSTSTPATPAGWTALTNYTSTGGAGAEAADTGIIRGTIFTREADGTETGSVTLSITGGTTVGAKILRFTKTTGKVWALAITAGSDNSAGATWSATAAANPGWLAGDICLVCSGASSDTAVLASQAITQTGVTFGTLIPRDSQAVTTGSDLKVQIDQFPVTSITTPSSTPVFTMTASGTGSTSEAGVSLFLRIRQVDAPVVLSLSANIAASAATATTAQLSAPGGKTFGAGDISDDTNPLPAVDLPNNGYTEDEFCLIATATAVNGEVYQFRLTRAGTAYDTYTQTPTWTIGAAAAGILYTQLEGATGRGLFRGMAGKVA